jgi:putative redox protein
MPRVEVRWEGEMGYLGSGERGGGLNLDGHGKSAASPVEALVMALAACSAVDVVDILEKRRTPVRALSVGAEFERALTYPRRLVSVELGFTVATDSTREHVERAITLSLDKYCSVSASLAPDTSITWKLTLAGE